MANSIGRLLKAVIEVQTKGTDKARDDLSKLANELDKVGKGKGVAGGFGPMTNGLKAVEKGANDAAKAVGLTKTETMALTYTINDVAAQLATGGVSPFTILLQQGGQVSQAFGGIAETLGKIPTILLKYAPAIAGALAAFAAFKFFNLPNIGAEAAKQINDVGKAADKASVSVEFLQKLAAAGIKVGVSSEESNKTAAQGLYSLREAALNAKDAQKELAKEIEATIKAQKGYVSPSDSTRASAEAATKLKSVFKDLGVSLSGFDGSQKATEALALNVARALENAYGPRKQEMIRSLGKVVGDDFSQTLALGRKGIESAADEITKSAVPLTTAQANLAKEATVLQNQVAKANERTSQAIDAGLMGADIERNKAALATLREGKAVVEDLGNSAKEASGSLETFYKVLQGDQQATKENPTIKAITDIPADAGKGILDALQMVSDTGGAIVDDLTGKTKTSFSDILTELGAQWAAFKNTSVGEVLKLSDEAARAANNTEKTSTSSGGIADALGRAAQNASTLAANTQSALQSAQQLEAVTARIANTGGPLVGGSQAPQYASGGFVSGPGSGTSDSILARLSNGEFVVRAAAVRAPGVLELLHRINGMRFSPSAILGRTKFADGGLVGLPAGLTGGGSGRTFNLVIDGRSFTGLTGGSDTITALEKYATLRQLSATSKRAPSRIG